MKILLIDDHVLIREALQGILKELRPDATVLEASNCSQGMRLAEEHADLEVILLDLNLPDGDGFNLLAELRELYPAVSIVVLSATNDRDKVMRALDLGAVGFIPKSTQRAVMLSGLELTLSGGIYIPPEILAREELPSSPALKQFATDRSRVSPRDLGMTERQGEVLALIMQGKSNKEICRVLDLSESTVKNHVGRILKALKVHNRTEAVVAIVSHERTRGHPQNRMNIAD
jgi:DNA-binding NarL/FixJ family response regulator